MAAPKQNQQQQPPPQSAPVAPPPVAAVPPTPAALAAAASALAALILSGATGIALAVAAAKILVKIASMAVVMFLVGFALSSMPDRQWPFPMGAAEADQERMAAAYRAWYVINASVRLEKAAKKGEEAFEKAKLREERYFQLHLRALRARQVASQQVDEAAREFGPLLGWKAHMDAATTLECREANGKNFRANAEPIIGWPGSVHPHCRCQAVRPYPGAPLIPSV